MSTRLRMPSPSPALFAALAFAFIADAAASGLQVAPTGLEFTGDAAAQALWLTNTGDAELRAQVRVFDWTQADGEDRLAPTQALVASPPMVVLAPGQRQLVRVIRAGSGTAAGHEHAYRLLVDELPQATQPAGVQYVLRYSVPVFIEPGADAAPAATSLAWSARLDGAVLVLEAGNRAARRAQVAGVELLAPDAAPLELVPGLLGYVLGGSTMRWSVDAPPASANAATRVRIKVDGEPVELPLAPHPVR